MQGYVQGGRRGVVNRERTGVDYPPQDLFECGPRAVARPKLLYQNWLSMRDGVAWGEGPKDVVDGVQECSPNARAV